MPVVPGGGGYRDICTNTSGEVLGCPLGLLPESGCLHLCPYSLLISLEWAESWAGRGASQGPRGRQEMDVLNVFRL